MKYKYFKAIFALLIIFSSHMIFADTQAYLKSKDMSIFYQDELKKLEAQKISDPQYETVTEKFFPGVKLEVLKYMKQKTEEGKGDILDLHHCKNLCLRYGTSPLRKKLNNLVKTDHISGRAQDCINKCDQLKNESELFFKGLSIGLKRRTEATNCNGIINSEDRNKNNKIINLDQNIDQINSQLGK